MKKIKLQGKLNLNKETISKLNDPQMHGVKGGAKEGGNNGLSLGRACTQVNNGCADTLDMGCTNGRYCHGHSDGIFCAGA